MDLSLGGKCALVTGGSRGIGKQIARMLSNEGVACVICGRDERRLVAAADELNQGSGSRVIPVAADLTDADSIEYLVVTATKHLEHIDILINNGARASGGEPEDLDHVSDDLILRDFQEKFLGYLRCARGVAPQMRAAGWGRIINMSGHSARFARNISAGARNAAVSNLTKALSMELGRDGITVNAIYPSVTRTESVEERVLSRANAANVSPSSLLDGIAADLAIRRLVTAEEIANVVTFLCSPLAAGITGEAIAVTGGVGSSVYY